MTLASGVRLGPYEILAPLGAGGMGEVYRARDSRLSRDVAIKVLPEHLAATPESRARLEREARAVAALNHPHICVLHDIGRHEDTDYLVLELVEGESLADRIARGPLPLEQVLRLGVEIADALEKAHRAGIVHRDLKPGNVMVTKSGAKLMDFGLARGTTPPGPASGVMSMTPTMTTPLTAQGAIVGTFQYMAPEQLEGREADHRADVWALGATLYEAATAKRAFEGQSQASLIAAIMHKEPRPLTELQPMSPPAFERAVKQCLAKEPEDRWQSAGDLKRELQWILEAGSKAGVPTPVAHRRVSRERIAWALAGIAIALAGVAVAGFLGRRSQDAQALLLALPPLSSGALQPSPAQAAISPDGRMLAFVADDTSGHRQLFLRGLGDAEPRQVPESESADYPFWSPDSRFVAFFTQDDGKLKKVPAAGGSPVAICNATWGRGGSWSKNGIIVLAPAPQGPLYRVSGAGGDPVPATALDTTRHESGHRFPCMLPDGDHFLYVALPGEGSVYDVMVGSLGSKRVKRVMRAGSAATYADPGYLLFEREGKVMAQRFDAGRLEVVGEAVPIAAAPAAGQATAPRLASASRNGVLTLYRTTLPETYLRWFDRSGAARGTIGLRPGRYLSPRLSPDGRRAALSHEISSAVWEVYVVDLARVVTTRISSPETYNYRPVWSPDGSRLVFGSNREGREEIYLQRADGAGEPERLATTDALFKSPTDWSPDGRWLVFQDLPGKTQFDIRLLSLQGDHKPMPFASTSAWEASGRVSPDGRWLAYESNESGRNEIYVQSFPEPGQRVQVSTNGGTEPCWTRGGSEIVYSGGKGMLTSVSVKAGASFEVGASRPIFQFPEGATGFDVTPDGERVLATVPSGRGIPPTLIVARNWTTLLKRR